MRSKKVVVAMSGGVDSSVCAALLLARGFSVIGATMQLNSPSPDGSGRNSLLHIKEAQKVARKLNIPHYVLNLRSLFSKKVISNFWTEYKAGRTPNPCIRCNRYIKFGSLLKKAKELGAAYLATGHYARIEFNQRKKKYLLKQGLDFQKDQSYFLYSLSQRQLSQVLMPLGDYTKDKVRKIAKSEGLPIAKGSESQDRCFRAVFPQATQPGPIKNKEGKIIGEHQGIIFYTVGQRKGIGIAAQEPLYVSSIDPKNNTIIVGRKEEVYGDRLIADDVHFIYLDKLKEPLKVGVKVRYLHPAAAATIFPLKEKRIRVKFKHPQWAITPGQAAVFYQKDIVVGGGTIL